MSDTEEEVNGQQTGFANHVIETLSRVGSLLSRVVGSLVYDVGLSSIDFLLSRLEAWLRPVARIIALVAKCSVYILVVYLLWLAIRDVGNLLFLLVVFSELELDGTTSFVALSIALLAWRLPSVLETVFQAKNGTTPESGHDEQQPKIGPTISGTASLGPVPASGLVGLPEAMLLIQEKWPTITEADALAFVWEWTERWKQDTTHTGMQDGKIIRKRFLAWVQETMLT